MELLQKKILTTWALRRSRRAAGVPGRGKYWLMNKLGNLYLLHRFIVSSKSLSVSVGKPQMISVAIEIPATLHQQIGNR